jgi:hypothetical protein
MQPALKIVTSTPLSEVWNDKGKLEASRTASIGSDEIKRLLRTGTVQFIIADAGRPLHWISPADCFSFWKSELQAHLASPNAKVGLANFPNDYCYFASLWEGSDASIPMVILEKHH